MIVEGRERLETRTGIVDTMRIAEEHQSVKTHAWIDLDGNVVREEALLGFTLEREPRERGARRRRRATRRSISWPRAAFRSRARSPTRARWRTSRCA